MEKEKISGIKKILITKTKFNQIIEDLKYSIPGLGGRIYKEDELMIDFLIVRRVLERHFEIIEGEEKEDAKFHIRIPPHESEF